jgi:hypothetical protein
MCASLALPQQLKEYRMTVATTGNNPAAWGQFAGAGQEDVNARDLRMPRLSIKGQGGLFVHSATKAEFPSMKCIVLGVVKQRAYFHKDQDEKDKRPICKSNDFDKGFPSEPQDQRHRLAFPWARAGYAADDSGTIKQADLSIVNGHTAIACEGCQMKEWDRANNKGMGCDEVHTYMVLILDDAGGTSPALFSLKRSQMAASRAFISAFAQAGQRPMFTAITEVTLHEKTRGTVFYAIPEFKVNMNETWGNVELWTQYYQQLTEVRDMIRADPRPNEEEEVVGAEAPPTWQAPAPQAAPAWQQFAEPPAATPPAPPAAPAPMAASAPAPAPSPQAAAPVPAAPPVAPPAPPAAPVAAPAPVAPTAPVAPPAAPADADDLPF